MDALSSCSSHPLSPLQYSSWHTTQGHRLSPSLSKLGFLTVQAKQAPEALSLSCCLPSLISPCYYTPLLHQRKQAFLPLAIPSSQPAISYHWHFPVFSLPLCRSSSWWAVRLVSCSNGGQGLRRHELAPSLPSWLAPWQPLRGMFPFLFLFIFVFYSLLLHLCVFVPPLCFYTVLPTTKAQNV